MMKCNIKRRGFTLVELLIVIVVIGILSAMMMLSSTEAVTSAKASNIVSNLRNLKTAALAMYIDNMDAFDNNTASIVADDNGTTGDGSDGKTYGIKAVVKYMNGGENFTEKGYAMVANTDGWFLKYTISGTNTEQAQIKEKLKGRAASVGLLADAKNAATTTPAAGQTPATTTPSTYAGGSDVYYFVR